MTPIDLAAAVAEGIITTGIEGGYGSISCSTAGDYPSIGVSQWEGLRADALLCGLPGGWAWAGKSYTYLRDAGILPRMAAVLESPEGQARQRARLATDCLSYITGLWNVSTLDRPECLVYAGMWCPTSLYVVVAFLKRREHQYDLRDLSALHALFRKDYARAADAEAYADGYRNRADATYQYVSAWAASLTGR